MSKIEKLRSLMQQHQVDAYIIPGTDDHQDEYLPEMWKRREWFSGFTGSAGTVVVTADRAGLWTDSRYFLQAEQQLAGSRIRLFKLGLPSVPDHWQWLKQELGTGMRIGIDPRLMTAGKARQVQKLFQPAGISLEFIESNLVDRIWENRPGFPLEPAVPHPIEYSGETVADKLERLRAELRKEHCQVTILSRLDSIAWLFNIRGSDIAYNPVVIAYALITPGEARLFLDPAQVTAELQAHLSGLAEICNYTEFKPAVQEFNKQQKRFWLDEHNTSAWITSQIYPANIYSAACPVIHFKAVKNETEIKNFRQAHIRDGVAMVKFLNWLYKSVPGGKITEARAASRLTRFRAANALYKNQSFPPISAYRDHGAVVHYSLEDRPGYTLAAAGIYLIDSGAHYLDGTTDITRTITLGRPTPEQQECFTRVLQGHIDLAQTSFPEGTQGIQLDSIARKPLWDQGLDYGHGTGHGIGSYLNVHEGPHAISQSRGVLVKLKEGMFCSNEPGFYKTGEFGIRIENIVYITRDIEKSKGETVFYQFKTISLCPIDLALVNRALLTEPQVAFLNGYHRIVREKLSPFLDEEERAWLKQATRPV